MKQCDVPQYVYDNDADLARCTQVLAAVLPAMRETSDTFTENPPSITVTHSHSLDPSTSSDNPESLPGAFRVVGINATGREEDEEEPMFQSSTLEEEHVAPVTNGPITARLVEPYEDRSMLLGEIEQLRAERENVARAEAVVMPEEDSDEEEVDDKHPHKCFPTRRRTLICLLCVILLAGVAVGAVIGIVAEDTPSPVGEVGVPLKGIITSVSFDNGTALNDATSPQFQALAWLNTNTNLKEYPDWRKIQRYVLATLFYSTDGSGWEQSDGWLSDEDECNWSHIEGHCQGEIVAELWFGHANLGGTLPPELALLSSGLVGALRFHKNGLMGTIPTELGLLTNLNGETFRVSADCLGLNRFTHALLIA